MKSFPKILTIFFLAAFIVQLFCLILLLALPQAGQAAEISLASPVTEQAKNIQFVPQVQGLNYSFDAKAGDTSNIANLIKAIYNYGIGIIGILAAVVLMIGGVLWIVAGGNATQIGEAKSWIGAALTGLILALTSYLILNTINPDLVNLQITKITGVGKLITGSCTTMDALGVPVCEDNVAQKACEDKKGQFTEGKTCPLPCCAYTVSSNFCGGCGITYVGCIDKEKNLTDHDCWLKSTTVGANSYMYKKNYKCFKFATLPTGTNYTCIPR